MFLHSSTPQPKTPTPTPCLHRPSPPSCSPRPLSVRYLCITHHACQRTHADETRKKKSGVKTNKHAVHFVFSREWCTCMQFLTPCNDVHTLQEPPLNMWLLQTLITLICSPPPSGTMSRTTLSVGPAEIWPMMLCGCLFVCLFVVTDVLLLPSTQPSSLARTLLLEPRVSPVYFNVFGGAQTLIFALFCCFSVSVCWFCVRAVNLFMMEDELANGAMCLDGTPTGYCKQYLIVYLVAFIMITHSWFAR